MKKTKITFDDIKELKEKQWDLNIVCLSWPISWEIPFYILSGKSDEDINNRIKEYKEVFEKIIIFLNLFIMMIFQNKN